MSGAHTFNRGGSATSIFNAPITVKMNRLVVDNISLDLSNLMKIEVGGSLVSCLKSDTFTIKENGVKSIYQKNIHNDIFVYIGRVSDTGASVGQYYGSSNNGEVVYNLDAVHADEYGIVSVNGISTYGKMMRIEIGDSSIDCINPDVIFITYNGVRTAYRKIISDDGFVIFSA